MRLDGSCIIVTGAAGNLGAAAVAELAQRGARLVCVDRSAENLAAVIGRLDRQADVLAVHGLDLSTPKDAAAMAKSALDRFGTINGLVNTIGGFVATPVDLNSIASFDAMMGLNARTVLTTSAAVLPAMVERKRGRIVHIAATAGNTGTARLSAYSASKAAVMRIVESLAAEHRADGIIANCILPSTIDTPQNRAAMPNADFSTWVTPAAIARVIAFLVSDDAAAVTGVNLPVTGRA